MESKIVRPSKLAHVVLKTSRFRELIDWYRLVLGADVVHANPMAAFLTYDDEHHRLAVLNMPQLPPNTRTAPGVDHIAFTYASLGELLGTWERLCDNGVEPVWAVNHGATTSLYYRDPDSNVIELQVDNFASREETDAFLTDGRFAINPIGIDFDPKEMFARFRAGESADALTRWPDEVAPRTAPLPDGYLR